VLLTQSPGANAMDAVQTDVALAQSRSVAGAALARLGLPDSILTRYLGSSSVAVITDRVVLITAQAPNSALAVRSAAALAAAFLQLRARELRVEQQLAVASLNQQVAQGQQQAAAIAAGLSQVSAQPGSPARTAELNSLGTEQEQVTSSLTDLEQAAAGYEASSLAANASVITGSQVLDPAAPLPRSRFRSTAACAAAGPAGGALVGLGIVVIGELVTCRLRRRDDVATALRAPVVLSLPGRRALLGGWLPASGPLTAGSRDMARIVAHRRASAARRAGPVAGRRPGRGRGR
jgi:hypothetical protein